jgi:hypothetical protein
MLTWTTAGHRLWAQLMLLPFDDVTQDQAASPHTDQSDGRDDCYRLFFLAGWHAERIGRNFVPKNRQSSPPQRQRDGAVWRS